MGAERKDVLKWLLKAGTEVIFSMSCRFLRILIKNGKDEKYVLQSSVQALGNYGTPTGYVRFNTRRFKHVSTKNRTFTLQESIDANNDILELGRGDDGRFHVFCDKYRVSLYFY